jgi:predicted transcriptional regulator
MPSPAHHLLAHHLRRAPTDPTPTIVLSLKPHYARAIAAGTKRVDFRRRFPRNIPAARALIYTSSPLQALTLTATITSVHRAPAADLWRLFSNIAGVTHDELATYLAGAPDPAAHLLADVHPLPHPIPLEDPRLRAAGFRPPQSFTVLPPDSPLLTFLHQEFA